MKIYEQFTKERNLVAETDFVKIYQCAVDDREYKIIVTKECANKRTAIHCVDNHIGWEQRPLFPRNSGYKPGEYIPVYKFSDDKSVVTLFVVRGKPRVIEGMDDGMFCCADRLTQGCVNVMSYKRFKGL